MIIEEDQLRADRQRVKCAKHARKISKRPKAKTSIEWPKKIVLMAGQNVAGLKRLDHLRKARTRVGQSDAQNRQIDLTTDWRQQAGTSPGFDVNAPISDLDQESERFAADPITNPLRRQGSNGLIEWDPTKDAIVLHRKNADGRTADVHLASARHRQATVSGNSDGSSQNDAGFGSDQRRAMSFEKMRCVEEMVAMAMGHKDCGDRAGAQRSPADLWLDDGAKVKRGSNQTHSREVGIDQQGRVAGLEQIGIGAEIRHSDCTAGYSAAAWWIVRDDEVCRATESGMRSAGCHEPEQNEKSFHPTHSMMMRTVPMATNQNAVQPPE